MAFAKQQNSLVLSPKSGSQVQYQSGESSVWGYLCTVSFQLCYLQPQTLCNPGPQRCNRLHVKERSRSLLCSGEGQGAHEHRLPSFTKYFLHCPVSGAAFGYSGPGSKHRYLDSLLRPHTLSKCYILRMQNYILMMHSYMRKLVLSSPKVAQVKSGQCRIWIEPCLTPVSPYTTLHLTMYHVPIYQSASLMESSNHSKTPQLPLSVRKHNW